MSKELTVIVIVMWPIDSSSSDHITSSSTISLPPDTVSYLMQCSVTY